MPEIVEVRHIVALSTPELEALVHSLGQTLVQRRPKHGTWKWDRWKASQSLYARLGRMYLGSS